MQSTTNRMTRVAEILTLPTLRDCFQLFIRVEFMSPLLVEVELASTLVSNERSGIWKPDTHMAREHRLSAPHGKFPTNIVWEWGQILD